MIRVRVILQLISFFVEALDLIFRHRGFMNETAV